MTIDLHGRTAIVCGASGGIGRSIAEKFALCGARVICSSRTEALLTEARDQLAGSGHDILVMDMDKPDQVAHQIKMYIREKGGIDIIVNNSGGPPAGPLTSASSEAFITAMNRLLLSAHEILRQCLPGMKQQSFGRIINVISTSVRQPIDGLGVSNTIRAATAAWSKTLSRELAPHGITVNNVLPGATQTSRLREIIERKAENTGTDQQQVETEMMAEIPIGRFARSEEVASAVAFLASAYADYISGTNLTVDGGRTRSLL